MALQHAAGVAARCTTDCWRTSRSGEREVGVEVGWTLPRAPGGQMVWPRFIFRNCLSEQALRCGEYIERSKGQEEQEGAGLEQKWGTGGGANLRALQGGVEDWALSGAANIM